MNWHRKNSKDTSGTASPASPTTLRQLGKQVALESAKTVTQSLVNSLFSSGPSRAAKESARRREEAEQRQMEAIRVEEARQGRLRAAAAMRSEWERRDAEMSERLAGVLDIVPARKSTPFFGIPGNPDDAALAEDPASDPWRSLFDGSSPNATLSQLEARLRELTAGTRTFEVEAGNFISDAPETLGVDPRGGVVGSPRPLLAGGAAQVALLQGIGRAEATLVSATPISFAIQTGGVQPTVIAPTRIAPFLVTPTPIQPLRVSKKCGCGGDDCHCIFGGAGNGRWPCGGTQGCGCPGNGCGCSANLCKFAGRNPFPLNSACCGGTHENSTNREQRCNATCGCTHTPGGPAGCSVDCRTCPNRPIAPDSRR